MNIKMLNVMMLSAGMAFASSASALSANTIEFIGEVTDQTCEVSINGNASIPVILLPTVSKTELNAAGKTAGETPFTISVTGCTADATKDLNIKTRFVANNLTSSNRIGNTGDAVNVALELFDPQNASASIDMTGATPAPGLVLVKDTTEASYDFGVRYYAEGAAQAGAVSGSVQYALLYR